MGRIVAHSDIVRGVLADRLPVVSILVQQWSQESLLLRWGQRGVDSSDKRRPERRRSTRAAVRSRLPHED